MNDVNHNGFSWLAGYLDALGRIDIGVTSRESPARLCVASIDREFLKEFQAIGGGTIQLRPGDNRGRRQKLYRWQLCGWPAAVLLEQVAPFMRNSHRQRRAGRAIRQCERRYFKREKHRSTQGKHVCKH